MPGIRSLHDFIFVRHPRTGDVMVRVRELCHEGIAQLSSMKLANGHLAAEVAIPNEHKTYRSCGLIKELSSAKRAHLVQMYRDFIPHDRHLNFLLP